MCVNNLTMVPAVVNMVASKGKDTYAGFINDLMCIKCKTLSTAEKEQHLDLADVIKVKNHPPKAVRAESPRGTFKSWRKGRTQPKTSSSSSSLAQSKSQKQQAAIRDATGVSGGGGQAGAGGNAPPEKKEEDMSLLQFLAINALDLSAPASDVLLKSRSSNWFQLSGHPDSLAPAGPGTVWKKRSGSQDETERTVYEEVSQDADIRDIIPKYYREVEYQGETFIELQDLLHGFQDPYVMDIKMGTRTFLECEVNKTTARNDLYQKMVAIDPSAPTADEHEIKAVTKLRYMQFRENQSSSCSHGFRIEAMKYRGTPPVKDLKKVKSAEQVANTLDMFVDGREDIRQRLVHRLKEMRTKIEQSDYFKAHEVIGSSVFMIYDNNRVGVWLIDFAKTMKVPDGVTVDHRKEWMQGNHEEGLLFGFDQLINLIENIETSRKNGDGLQNSLSTVTVKS